MQLNELSAIKHNIDDIKRHRKYETVTIKPNNYGLAHII